MAEFKLGQTIELNDGRKGIVRFVGSIHVSEGDFLGIELPDAGGKNDGSVRGERYFNCDPGHGLFVRPSGVSRVVAQPAAAAAARPRPTAPATSNNTKTTPARVRPSPNVIPTTSKTSATAGTTSKPPSTSSATNRLSRQSLVRPTGRAGSRQSITPAAPAAPTAPSAHSRKTSAASASTATSRRTSTLFSPSSKVTSSPASSAPSLSRPPAPSTKPSSRDTNVEALETKIRHLEKQHAEDKETIKRVDQLQQERDKFEGIIQKLQAKCQSFHQDNTELKAQLKENASELERLSQVEEEHDTILELATLDREMAEEKAEAAEAQAEALKQRLEEQELELDILRGEAELLSKDLNEEDREAAGFYLLQNENDRLKQALLTLKDITQTTESELRLRIDELENDVKDLDSLRRDNGNLKSLASSQEYMISELQQQLDAANEWEEMLEELSDLNQTLKEKVAERDLTIADLEALKELNDELELQHIAHAAELREELEAKDLQLSEQAAKLAKQDAAIVDQEECINKFRDAVLDLQAHMAEAEMSKTLSDEQSKDLTTRFHEVMDANRQLRNANTTTTARNISTELQKLHADQYREELEIVKGFLPNASEVYANNSIRTYFRCKQLAFKAQIVSRFLKQKEYRLDIVAEPLDELARIDAIQKLNDISACCERLWHAMSSSSLQQFADLGLVYHELEPVDRTLELCLDSLRKEQIKPQELVDQLQRSVFVLESVSTDRVGAVHPADDLILRVTTLRGNYDTIAATFALVASTADGLGLIHGEEDDSLPRLMKDLNNRVEQSNEVALATAKFLRALETLCEDSMYPHDATDLQAVAERDAFVRDLLKPTKAYASEFLRYLSNHDADTITSAEVASYHERLLEQHFAQGATYDMESTLTKVTAWHDSASVLDNAVEIERGTAPWTLKANEMAAAKQQNIEAERRLQVLTTEHHSTILQLRERDEIIETKDLEIEHLRAKHKEASTKAEALSTLQEEFQEAEKERKRLQQDLKTQLGEIQALKATAHAPATTLPIEDHIPTSLPVPEEGHEALVGQSKPVPTISTTFVDALDSENRWLRQKENGKVLGSTTPSVSMNLRRKHAQGERQVMFAAQRGADAALCRTTIEAAEASPRRPESKTTTEAVTKDDKSSLHSGLLGPKLDVPSSIGRRSPSPLLLTPLKNPFALTSDAPTPEPLRRAYAELDVDDLSPILEEFPSVEDEGSDNEFDDDAPFISWNGRCYFYA